MNSGQQSIVHPTNKKCKIKARYTKHPKEEVKLHRTHDIEPRESCDIDSEDDESNLSTIYNYSSTNVRMRENSHNTLRQKDNTLDTSSRYCISKQG